MGWFRFKKEKLDLEKLAREAITVRGIKVVASPPDGERYGPTEITGIGQSERDDHGALNNFITNLERKRPAYVRENTTINTGYVGAGEHREARRKISVTGYVPKPTQSEAA